MNLLNKNNKKKVIEIKKLDFKNIIPNTTTKPKTTRPTTKPTTVKTENNK